MTLHKLKTSPVILVEDYSNRNILPLLIDLVEHEKNSLKIFCYEQPISVWSRAFKMLNVTYHEDFNPNHFNNYTDSKTCIIIDSVNQMSLSLGWNACLKTLKKLIKNSNVEKLILILHRDCILHSSKQQLHLNHIAHAIVTYDEINTYKIWLKLRKGGKILRAEELLSFDHNTHTLKSSPVVKETLKNDEPRKLTPENLSTFKIEVDQTEQLEKYKLKLPYMSKINEGESTVYYEPDSVDDWDEEDPDDDLDI